MNFYQYLRTLLFLIPPESAHHLSLEALKLRTNLQHLITKETLKQGERKYHLMGLEFPNRLGLAAGLDKNGEYIDALASLGFGFIEVGTVTPRPQPGNPRPRLFRLPEQQAIINRMGFNNKGIDYLVERVRRARYNGILGINIGKNADTEIKDAARDYITGLEKAYPHASYITVNVSSPNTRNLRSLQEKDSLEALLDKLKNKQDQLRTSCQRTVPILIKIAPDLEEHEIDSMSRLLLKYKIDGLIATNTTVDRAVLPDDAKYRNEPGGLSGKPLLVKSTDVMARFAEKLEGKVPVIAAGGIMSREDACLKIQKGASLLQVYTGLIYKGPNLVHEIVENDNW